MPPAPNPEAENLAIEALVFLAQDQERLSRFLAMTGLEGQDLRAASQQSGFLASVMEYLTQDESLLLTFAAEKHLKPETVVRTALKLAGEDGTPRQGSWRESW